MALHAGGWPHALHVKLLTDLLQRHQVIRQDFPRGRSGDSFAVAIGMVSFMPMVREGLSAEHLGPLACSP